MVSYAYLNEADFSKLAHSAESWKLLKKKYDGIGEQFDHQIIKRLQKSWSGEAATKAFDHMRTATKQYDNAGIEAHRMGKLMADAHDEFTGAQKKLRTFQDDVAAEHFKIHDGTGAIEDVHPNWNSPTASSQPGWGEERRKKQDGYARQLKQILHHATQIDQDYAAAFSADFNGDEKAGFNKSGYSSDNQVAKAEQDAKRAADLMKGNASPTELDELNKLLSKHAHDPVFAENFAKTRGADGTLKAYMAMMNPPPGTPQSQKAVLKKIQKNLGTTLGTATRVDSAAMDKFQRNLMAARENEYRSSGGAAGAHTYNGFQLTSSLTANGDWDNKFMDQFGTELIKHENDKFQFWGSDRESYWGGDGSNLGLINSDPMVGFSDGLGHNPDAATEFLSGSTETDDGKVNNLDYLLKDREWHGGEADKAHFGHALEAATTGHSYEQDPQIPIPPHTQEQADIMSNVIKTVGEHPDVAGDGMKDSLGDMGAEYTADLNRALCIDQSEVDKIMPVAGAKLDIGETAATRFLYQVSSDPQGHAAIMLGQQQYTADLIAYHAEHPEALDLDFEEKMQKIAEVSGRAEGITAHAYSDEIIREGIEKNKEFNSALENGSKLADAVISVGGAAGGLPGAAAGEAGKLVLGEIVDAAKQDSYSKDSWDAAVEMADSKKQSYNNIWAGLRGAGVEPPPGISESEFHNSVVNGFTKGWGESNDDVENYVTNRPEDA